MDGTFHYPAGFSQLLLIMYKDLITEKKIPCFYILLSSKEEYLYDIIFNSILNIRMIQNLK